MIARLNKHIFCDTTTVQLIYKSVLVTAMEFACYKNVLWQRVEERL